MDMGYILAPDLVMVAGLLVGIFVVPLVVARIHNDS